MRKAPYTLQQQLAAFWSKVRRTETCWIWEGATWWDGYGHAIFDGKDAAAHRVAWMLSHGTWPEQQIDHLCHTPLCVRFDHLRDVSRKVNMNSRICSMICKRGHKLEDPNLYYWYSNGEKKRRCLACIMREREKAKVKYKRAK